MTKRLNKITERAGYGWAGGGVAAATGLFWLARHWLDKGQASLLYLPVVIACALRFGFGPAVFGAVLSFLCWDFFFLPPYGTFLIADIRDWLSLFVFLLAAITTALLAARARQEARAAEARERETATLYEASEAVSREVAADRLLPALAEQVVQSCGASYCLALRHEPNNNNLTVAALFPEAAVGEDELRLIRPMAATAEEYYRTIGFDRTTHLWQRALETSPVSARPSAGAYVPLRAAGGAVGVLHVGPRRDGLPFSPQDERLILALANHAAIVIARQTLAEEAAQAAVLRDADTLKDALLSLVSHELRTPLATIKAMASGLRQHESVWDDTMRQEAIASIDTEADRLTALVSNLLDLSRLEAGAWHPNKDWCDLREIVGTALDRLPSLDSARVTVTAPADLPFVCADYVQIALVLTNLLQNAVKYAPDSPIQVTVTSGRVSVRDFGEGIAAGEEECLFERFYRGKRHRESMVHGTGLGLALCRAVIDAHGGRLWAANASDGPGAAFTFSLPLAAE